MPTYQYVCTACGHAFDQVQSFSDDSLTTCPECQGALRKVFSAVGVVFKGSGFYRTDSRGKEASAAPAAASGSDAGATTTGSESGSSTASGSGAASAPASAPTAPAPAPASKPAASTSTSSD